LLTQPQNNDQGVPEMGVNQGVPEKRELFNVALLALQGKEKCEKGSELLSKTGDLVATE